MKVPAWSGECRVVWSKQGQQMRFCLGLKLPVLLNIQYEKCGIKSMDANVYTQVKASIKQRLRIDLENYKDEQMKRRLDSWLVRTHANTSDEYFGLLSRSILNLCLIE